MKTPKEQVLEAIDSEAFYQSYYPDLLFNEDGEGANNVSCFMHEDDNPSLSIHSTKGGKCHGCDGTFKDTLGFAYLWEKNQGTEASYDTIVKKLYHNHVHPLVNPKVAKRWYRELRKNPVMEQQLAARCVDSIDIDKYGIGYDVDEDRITIPIKNIEGWITDVRKISLEKGNKKKNLPYDWQNAKDKRERGEKTHGKGGRLFPIANLIKQNIIICEGEFDAILLNKYGFNGVTAGGVTEWKKFSHHLKGKNVTILFDNDVDKENNPGQTAANKLLKQLYPVCKSVRNAVFPSGDVTDFFKAGGTAQTLSEILGANEPVEEEPKDETITPVATIAGLLDPKYYGKRVSVEARMIGEKEEYYSLPKTYTVGCEMDLGDRCLNCPMMALQGRFNGSIKAGSDESISHIGLADKAIALDIKGRNGFPTNCKKLEFTRHDVTSVHSIAIAPSMARDAKKTEIDRLTVFTMGAKLEMNSEYNFMGRVTHDPQTQQTIFLIDDSERKEMSFRNFRTPEESIRTDMKRKFAPKKMTPQAIVDKHNEINEILSNNVTYIYGRPHLHTAIDLTFHSPLQINFEGVTRNSYMETVIIGDTNTGKNEVLDRMCSHYGSGVVVDSGATSRAGLIGGSDNGLFSWGLYVQQHGKLIGLDEGSHLSETIQMLRTIREGKADYVKVNAKRQTTCMARLVILANDPGGALSSNPYPVTSLSTLFNEPADISRFTMAYFMREEDVDASIMNRVKPDMIDTDITREDFQLRLANAWALGVDQINISDATVQEVYKQAKRISGKYSSRIPIVQKETMKKKLPSMAAALAATQYNMSDDGKQLIVLPEHVIAVCMLLEEHYDSDACQYDMYSENEFTNSSLTDVTMVDAIFEEEAKVTGGKITHCIQHLLSQRDIDIDYLSDSFVYCELPMATRRVLKTFVVNRCLERKGRVYVKTKAFTQYLKDKKKQRKEA